MSKNVKELFGGYPWQWRIVRSHGQDDNQYVAEVRSAHGQEVINTFTGKTDKAALHAAERYRKAHIDQWVAAALAQANSGIVEAATNVYFTDLLKAVERIVGIVEKAGFSVDYLAGSAMPHGRLFADARRQEEGTSGTLHLDLRYSDGQDAQLKPALHISYYQMASGRWEIVPYIN